RAPSSPRTRRPITTGRSCWDGAVTHHATKPWPVVMGPGSRPGRQRCAWNHKRKEVNACQLDAAYRWPHFCSGCIQRAHLMLRRVVICLAFIVLGISAGRAAERQQTNPVPFAHTPCSVLDEGPCTPSYCSVFNHGPCIPEMDYPYGENLQVTIL